jgi:hypothetical protein
VLRRAGSRRDVAEPQRVLERLVHHQVPVDDVEHAPPSAATTTATSSTDVLPSLVGMSIRARTLAAYAATTGGWPRCRWSGD